MGLPTNRQELIDFCLKKLGYPVIQINIDDDQLEDRVDEAILFWRDYHFDSVERIYLKHQVTAGDVANNSITLPSSIVGVTRIFPFSSSQTLNMWNLNYQIRLNDLYNFTSVSPVYYVQVQQHVRMLDMLFTGEMPIRFNRKMNKIFIDGAWGTTIIEGSWLVIESQHVLDLEEYPNIWGDLMLIQLVTALFLEQWGNNLSKHIGIAMPGPAGGVMLNGDKIRERGEKAVADTKQEIIDTYSEPVPMMIG